MLKNFRADPVAKSAVRMRLIGSFVRLCLAFVFYSLSVEGGPSIFRHISFLVLIWDAADLVFVFTPNFVRHCRRWRRFEDYRRDAVTEMRKSNALTTIYSDLLDRYPV